MQIWLDGRRYVGNWECDMMNDTEGTMTWMDGRSYVGCFVDNRREGHGLCIQKNGKKYEG